MGEQQANHVRQLTEEEKTALIDGLKAKWEKGNTDYQATTHITKLESIGKVRRKEQQRLCSLRLRRTLRSSTSGRSSWTLRASNPSCGARCACSLAGEAKPGCRAMRRQSGSSAAAVARSAFFAATIMQPHSAKADVLAEQGFSLLRSCSSTAPRRMCKRVLRAGLGC